MKKLFYLILICSLFACSAALPVSESADDMRFPSLATSWDESVPLGNATVGALVWQKDSVMRFSLDRTDLWDLRPVDSISGSNNRFSWVLEQVKNGDYLPVQKKYDWPYDMSPAPSKIPGAALEFFVKEWGEPCDVRLYIKNALCLVKWNNGVEMKTFVHATKPIGWFVFENLPDTIDFTIVPPNYGPASGVAADGPVAGQDLRRLGYEQGTVTKGDRSISFHQKGWGGFYYDVNVRWRYDGNKLYGVWGVSSSMADEDIADITKEALSGGITKDYASHLSYWDKYWGASSVSVPDTILQKQYDQEMYRLGSIARENSYPISLQAVWTADNGKLPPWKGDYHHDLNTQLSYWPVYAGNHLEEGLGYLNTLWSQREVYKKYTKTYYQCEGMNIPGVCTLSGEPMGGWIQYSMSPTVSAWLSHHFYMHWKYSMDDEFLKERAYPFVRDVVTFLENFSELDANGVRKLPLSSSPEMFDNSINAWFGTTTNYDLALMKFAFGAASEMAGALGLSDDEAHWKLMQGQLPEFDVDDENVLTIAKGFPYKSSHRHFSHAMAIHPLGLVDVSNGEKDAKIVDATLDRLANVGPAWWCGYSYSWFANMRARNFDGKGAAEALHTFAECFCLKNGFHANGDQTASGKSNFTYRPFTLEGNMAFAAAMHEMLLQSHTGTVRVFPAIPSEWKNVSFRSLRAMGAFVVDAEMRDGSLHSLAIRSEKGATLKLYNSFGDGYVMYNGKDRVPAAGNVWTTDTAPNDVIIVKKEM
ncbi:MAG: hypothetical protein NC113_08430 [Bacteroides sp.]|nr:hypothetical protein [Bacteroides sp.]MCM1448223.1 hypothetical protein [Bacteroides sp.]